jgi:hypothetical protein
MNGKLVGLFLAIAAATSCPNENLCRQCSYDQFAGDHICLVCDRAFLNPHTNTCDHRLTVKIDHCLTYIQKPEFVQSSCTDCEDGWAIVDAKNTCVKCETEGCARCNPEGQVCHACFGNKKLVADGIRFKCSEEKCPFDHCEVCEYDADMKTHQCARCITDFALDTIDGKCKEAKNKHCLRTKYDKCFLCDVGFSILENGDCAVTSYPVNGRLFGIVVIGFVVAILVAWLAQKKKSPRNFRHSTDYQLVN